MIYWKGGNPIKMSKKEARKLSIVVSGILDSPKGTVINSPKATKTNNKKKNRKSR